jgi:transposase
MKKTDLRFESEAVRLAFRKRAITLLKGGKKKKEIAIILGVSVNTLTY